MENEEKLQIIKKAYAIACKLIHDNPPSDMNIYNNSDYLRALLHAQDDLEGRYWQIAFLNQALKEKGEL